MSWIGIPSDPDALLRFLVFIVFRIYFAVGMEVFIGRVGKIREVEE